MLPRAEIVCKNGEAEGAVFAEVLLTGADGGYRSATLSLPFAFPLDTNGLHAETDCIVCGLNLRRRKEGGTEAEATLKIVTRCYEEREWSYLGAVKEGAPYEAEKSAFSVYVPVEGEELWSLAKRLKQTPEELVRCNPELSFPVPAGQRIYVYRQIR